MKFLSFFQKGKAFSEDFHDSLQILLLSKISNADINSLKVSDEVGYVFVVTSRLIELNRRLAGRILETFFFCFVLEFNCMPLIGLSHWLNMPQTLSRSESPKRPKKVIRGLILL